MPCCNNNGDDHQYYDCMKHQVKVCAACAKCTDPGLYCKFRPSCMIHFLEKEQSRGNKKAAK